MIAKSLTWMHIFEEKQNQTKTKEKLTLKQIRIVPVELESD